MADNQINVIFDECEPQPVNGYRVSYRPSGSDEAYRIWPSNFIGTPAVFTDTLDPAGTNYEGYIQGDCGDAGLGVPSRWTTGENSGASEPDESPGQEDLMIVNDTGMAITGIFTIPVGGEPGDSKQVTCDEGYPLAAGQQSNGAIHADHNGDSDLNVLVFFDDIATTFHRVHVTDSDETEGCDQGNNLAAVIGVEGPFRLNNSEGWSIVVNGIPC
jgi:hypothetical protein